jgi:SulP family sulfate permease
LAGPALALSVVAMCQSISVARTIGERSGQHIDPNREFFGQGLANVVASFSSSYLSCGSLNRSLPNFDMGAKTPLAAVFSSALLLGLVAVSASMLERIPMASISALLLYVAWALIDVNKIRAAMKFSHQESVCLGATWAAMLLIDIELAILVGVVLSLLFYLQLTSKPAMRVLVPHGEGRRFTPLEELDENLPECPQLKLVRMEGSVYFGAAEQVSNTLRHYREAHPLQRHLLVMVKSMNFIDHAGERVWRMELEAREKMGGSLGFHRPRSRVIEAWRRSGFLVRLGAHRIFDNKSTALATVVPSLDQMVCADCRARVFMECPEQGGARWKSPLEGGG